MYSAKYESDSAYSYNDQFDFSSLIRYFLDTFNPPINSSILDIGFGRGEVLSELQKVNQGFQLYGLERSAIMAEKIMDRIPSLKLLPYGYGNIELPSNKLDYVIARYSLSHLLTDMNSLNYQLREIRRVLKPSGLFWFTDINQTNELLDFRPVLNYKTDGSPQLVPLKTGPEWFDIMRNSGMHIYHYRNPNEVLNIPAFDKPYHFVDIYLCKSL